ncbi:MAG TPA: nucleotidyltransferase domain-containing protein [Chloroflexota bacterium]|nr:nucleotidyltransferase domain-containing protein [Chloroflexota bacterium]
MAVPSALDTLPPQLLERILQRCLEGEVEPLAVLVTGSYAANRATPQSDLDLTTLLRGEPETGYRTWFEDRPGRMLHVSVDFQQLESWLRRAGEPADWSLGFPTVTVGRMLWARPEARAALPDPPDLCCPAGEPELEDFVEAAMKTRREIAAGDRHAARWYAHRMAVLAPGLLVPLNPERRVGDRREAMEAALSLTIAPANYREDLIACLGLEAVPRAAFELSSRRLPAEMLAFLREHCPDISPQPWLSRYLRDGTLARHLQAWEPAAESE